MRIKKNGFALPSTICAILVISVFTLLMVTFIASATISNNYLITTSKSKIRAEKIFFEFKNDISLSYDSLEITTYSENSNDKIRAIIVSKSGVIMFGIYDFEKKETICYQTVNFAYDIDSSGNLIYGNLTFTQETIAEPVTENGTSGTNESYNFNQPFLVQSIDENSSEVYTEIALENPEFKITSSSKNLEVGSTNEIAQIKIDYDNSNLCCTVSSEKLNLIAGVSE